MRIDRLAVGSTAPAVLVLVLSSATVHAQSPIVTVSAGPASVTNLSAGDLAWQFGGGAERPDWAFGFGGEIDFVYFPARTRTLEAGRGASRSPASSLPAFTLKGSHHFRVDRRVRPFVSGGVTVLGGHADFGTLLFAGGVDVWTGRRVGLRFEVREQFPIMTAFRCGVVFR